MEPTALSEEQKAVRREQLHDLLSGHFRPAKSAADAENMFTTAHMLSIIQDHSPGLVEPAGLREMLLDLGYQEVFVQDEFRWLVRSR